MYNKEQENPQHCILILQENLIPNLYSLLIDLLICQTKLLFQIFFMTFRLSKAMAQNNGLSR